MKPEYVEVQSDYVTGKPYIENWWLTGNIAFIKRSKCIDSVIQYNRMISFSEMPRRLKGWDAE